MHNEYTEMFAVYILGGLFATVCFVATITLIIMTIITVFDKTANIDERIGLSLFGLFVTGISSLAFVFTCENIYKYEPRAELPHLPHIKFEIKR